MNLIGKVKLFTNETLAELRKTSWPTRSEFGRATWVVLCGALLIGGFVSVVDFSLFQVVNLLIDIAR
jgi:preprotein translocase SecE subunit